MDPLTISTSIITLLQAASSIISFCYDFKAALNNAPWSLTQIIDEMKCLRNILESLESFAQNEKRLPARLKTLPTFNLLSKPHSGPLDTCLKELTYVEKKIISSTCIGTSGPRRRAILQSLGWQFNNKEIKECIERIERCKTMLNLALTAGEATLLVNISNATTSVQATVQNTDYKITMMGNLLKSRETDEKHEAIIRWLSPVDPHENHDAAISAHRRGTGAWIIESKEFIEWRQSKSSCLWISGFPGAGKTMLFSQIVTHLARSRGEVSQGSAVAYFYCDFAQKEFQEGRNVAGSLVAQLCSKLGCPDDLALAYQSSLVSSQRRNPSWETLRKALCWFSTHWKVSILIDALDECANRTDLLNLLISLRESNDNISVLVTSRNEPNIECMLHTFSRLQIEKHHYEMDADIKAYIDHRLNSESDFKALPLAIKAEIKHSLDSRWDGMFRWAQCQLDAISELRTTRAIRSSLNHLPKGLNETYARIIKRANNANTELLRRILLWVSFSVLPLTLEELREAVAIEPGLGTLAEVCDSRIHDPQYILALASSLLRISETGHVRLAHLSVKDYLLSEDIKTDSLVSKFAMIPERANQELAMNCITYLRLDSLAGGPSSSLQHWQERLENHPLLKHVAKGWTYYLRKGESSPGLRKLVSEFFSPRLRETFMSWIQVLNSNWIFKWDDYPRHATSLYYTASFGLLDLVNDYIKNGVDLNAPGSRFGGTPLHGATLRQHIPVMKALLRAGADPSQADFNQITPLHTAVVYGNTEVIKLLLKFGASKYKTDSLGKTPCEWAKMSGLDMSRKLMQAEAEDYQTLKECPKRSPGEVYFRAAPLFQAMAVAQGFPLPQLVEKL